MMQAEVLLDKFSHEDAILNNLNFKRGRVEDHVKTLIGEYNSRNASHQHPMVVTSGPRLYQYEGQMW